MKSNREFLSAPCLNEGATIGYGQLPIPCALDDQITDLVDEWATLDQRARTEISRAITVRQQQVLLCYSERMSIRAVRERLEKWIRLGLLALGIDDWNPDRRENLRVLALHHDACARIGHSPTELFREAGALLGDNARLGLEDYLERELANRSIAVMGYEADGTAGSFVYRRNW